MTDDSHALDHIINELRSKVRAYEKVLKEIKMYQAYSWNNDRQFIDGKIDEVLKSK